MSSEIRLLHRAEGLLCVAEFSYFNDVALRDALLKDLREYLKDEVEQDNPVMSAGEERVRLEMREHQATAREALELLRRWERVSAWVQPETPVPPAKPSWSDIDFELTRLGYDTRALLKRTE